MSQLFLRFDVKTVSNGQKTVRNVAAVKLGIGI